MALIDKTFCRLKVKEQIHNNAIIEITSSISLTNASHFVFLSTVEKASIIAGQTVAIGPKIYASKASSLTTALSGSQIKTRLSRYRNNNLFKVTGHIGH